MFSSDTIAALSTPPGQSGLAVVRASGESALEILSRIFRPATTFEHRRLYHGAIVSRDGETVDEVMVAVMRAPASYTGEDTAEISCHGGTAVVTALLETLLEAGARPAEAGEFTRRAFLNGKMDLIQAEAVADLIHARSELQRRVATRQLSGGLSSRIDGLADDALGLLAVVEANIDFIEDDIDTIDVESTEAMLARQVATLDELLTSAALMRRFRDGYQVVLAGAVNAGKSSLFNRLVGESRAIVTDIPGTTRDVLRESVSWDGLLFVLHDTAGHRDGAGDRVETIGMGLAARAREDADLVCHVIDASRPFSDSDASALGTLEGQPTLVLLNKSDLPARVDRDIIMSTRPGVRALSVSAETGTGIEAVRAEIVRGVGGADLVRMARERTVLNARLAGLLGEARERASALRERLRESRELETLAADVRALLGCYERATGRRYEDSLLDVIFSRFCIGK